MTRIALKPRKRLLTDAVVRKIVAEALRAVADELDEHRPSIWPSSSEEDRIAAGPTNDAIDAVQRSLNRTADNLTRRKGRETR